MAKLAINNSNFVFSNPSNNPITFHCIGLHTHFEQMLIYFIIILLYIVSYVSELFSNTISVNKIFPIVWGTVVIQNFRAL